ncbi:MAG: chain-length determining protein [Alistipes sp.]|nr:chain-length determining protein [Alistipes sp.]
MNNEMQQSAGAGEEQIDLMELVRKVWAERRMVLRWCGYAVIFALAVAFSIPKEYTVETTLAPETSDGKNSLSGLGSLASLAGINVGNLGSSSDAVYPELYPDIVASVPFLVELFDVQVVAHDGDLQTDIYDYVDNHLRKPWWQAVLRVPFRALKGIRALFGDKPDNGTQVDPFRLTKDQFEVFRALDRRIDVSVDKKTSLVTLSVTMQDPVVAAMLADTVMYNLQKYITEYRTNKARNDLKFTQQLFDEAKQSYYEAQQQYARYVDANQNIVLRSVRTEQERLENEAELAYNVYNQVAQQLQLSKAKVQESTPVYVIVQPATVPLKPSAPSKALILVGCVFLAGVAAMCWILFGRDFYGKCRNCSED